MFWNLKTRRGWLGYVAAVLIVAFAAAVRLELLQGLGMRAPYITFYPAEALAAAFGGLGPGLLAAGIGGILASFLWIEPIGHIMIGSSADMLSMVVFLLSCSIVSVICEAMHRVQMRLHDSREESASKSRLLDFAHDYIMVRDLDSRIVYWNQGAERGYGFTAAEAEGRVTHELLKTEFPETADAIQAELLACGHWEGELIHTRKDGVRVVVQSTQTLNRDQAGNPVTMLEINHDVTDKKKNEQRIHEQSQLLDFAHDCIMVRGMDERILYWNRGAEIGYGWSASEALGQIKHLLLATKFPEPIDQILNSLVQQGYWEGELTHNRKDGREIIVESHWTLNRDEAGNPVSIMEINHNITEQKKIEEMVRETNLRLRRFNAELESKVEERTRELQDINATLEEEIMERQAVQEELVDSRDILLKSEMQLRKFSEELLETNKELTSYSNSIAHDFRSPMVNLKGFSSELGTSLAEIRQVLGNESVRMSEQVKEKLDELLDKDVPESLNFIYSAVERLDRMVNALLELARMGRNEVVLQEVEMSALVHQVAQSFRHQIETNNIQITVGPMPIVKTNGLAMEQIIGNLVDNAVKYLILDRPGKIAVTCIDECDRYVFSVEDNGRGIAEGDCEKIFEIFRRAGKQDVPGDGMGLAYVRRLVRKLGGRVWCESKLGMGTKMMFTLPKKS